MPNAEIDELTLARAKQGDEAARRALVERYARPVFALLGRTLGRRPGPLVEDLAQETFLRVFRALPRFTSEGPAKLSTWILRIATNLAIDEMRRRRPLVVADTESRALPANTRDDADHQTRRRQLAEHLEAAIAELPPAYRAAFVLREYHDLDYAEIADMLEVETGTVKSRLNRARQRLRERLASVWAAETGSNGGQRR